MYLCKEGVPRKEMDNTNSAGQLFEYSVTGDDWAYSLSSIFLSKAWSDEGEVGLYGYARMLAC